MRAGPVVSGALLAAGVGLVADAVVRGGARASLVVVIPVVSGGSAEFLVGVLLLVVGFFSLPFTLGTLAAPEPSSGTDPSPSPWSHGGVVLIGPVPLFFGSWRSLSRRARWAWVAVGGAVTVAIVVAAFLAA